METTPKKEEAERNRRRTVTGVVTGDKMEKTITVDVQRLVRHAKFGKYLRKTTTCKAHDEKREAHVGDRVELMETRPLSATKRWRLLRIVEKAPESAKAAPAGPKPGLPAGGSASAPGAPADKSAQAGTTP
ncbi:MAG: 30S ribosomal protein S17 [Planctomycetes bacterium]|nr:30S ribosomal protein S17 [Planctomycetota bacterium]